ncbi:MULTISPECIES: DUF2200 family protein [unclassified Enterococcus]|uniref:DUF2200 family protein n=1 Tax=unclassified Enterococcus TaxID=2608891 RepID=UPI001556CB34|nr:MULTISPECIES: DUF2200 family protein [unclassified Enterococcus]MBS7577322.1 DUF2200 family protein [Enterococcus sp. MMGLQ5-2]MBS7584585.1 DUF2200 family protein [Enterococcus sp. MMGLQ5-1]NPD12440.1 DUF2200 family protein [Enterococcus sp. MMGLQ5-1]NPD37156.1 DUF2200 family protein [Enterococcus sp. MMGLQ5-2]
MKFGNIYSLYLKKVQRKNRTQKELDEVLAWLTGLDAEKLQKLRDYTLVDFFQTVQLNSKIKQITGVVCGIRVELIEDELMQKIRYMDKIVDELAKGWSIDRIKRQS